MRRIISALLGAAALITAYAAVPAQAAVTAPAGPVVLGSVLAAGQPVAGAEVTLYAWPDQAVTSAMTDGQQVRRCRLAQTTGSST